MDWLIDTQQSYQTELALLKKMTQVTLYDHNSVLTTNLQNLSFSCVLNCKRLNRQYSILGKVEGDLRTHAIQISCALVGYNRIVTGKWQHQKIQLTKFAYKYNQKSARASATKGNQENANYLIKVNPLSGQFYVCFHFILGYDLIKDYEKFKMKITDQCQKLTSEVQKIFNTIIQVIFDQQANDPYLKSDEKVGMHFSRPVKMGKLLKKIKKMNTISSYYKIKQDIASQNKFRSAFKKVFLKKFQKCTHNPLIIQNALLFIPKFCKKHVQALPQTAQPAKRKNAMITPFQDLQDNHQLQFASRHLQDFSKPKPGQSIVQLSNLLPQEKATLSQPGIHNIRGHLIQVQRIGKERKIYQYQLINKLNFKYQYIAQYFHLKGQQFINLRITQYVEQTSLADFLQRNVHTLSLTTRLDLMVQICHVIQVFHKFNIGYFLDFKNIYLVDGVIKIKDFTSAYSLCNWDETKQKDKDFLQKKFLMSNYKQYLLICGYTKTDDNSKDRMEDQKQRDKAKFQNERADIFTLGMVLYRVLNGKFPFSLNCLSILQQNPHKVEEVLNQIWTVETEYYLKQGGLVVKLLAHLLLKCLYLQVEKRPYVEWITVILSEVKSSIQCLY